LMDMNWMRTSGVEVSTNLDLPCEIIINHQQPSYLFINVKLSAHINFDNNQGKDPFKFSAKSKGFSWTKKSTASNKSCSKIRLPFQMPYSSVSYAFSSSSLVISNYSRWLPRITRFKSPCE
jgi:hypothetical protein